MTPQDGTLLADRMRKRADADQLPASHPLRITAAELDRAFNANVCIDVSSLTVQYEAAVKAWDAYNEKPP